MTQTIKIQDIGERIALATTTFYNPDSESDNYRTELAKDMISRCSNFGYDLVVVDGG